MDGGYTQHYNWYSRCLLARHSIPCWMATILLLLSGSPSSWGAPLFPPPHSMVVVDSVTYIHIIYTTVYLLLRKPRYCSPPRIVYVTTHILPSTWASVVVVLPSPE